MQLQNGFNCFGTNHTVLFSKSCPYWLIQSASSFLFSIFHINWSDPALKTHTQAPSLSLFLSCSTVGLSDSCRFFGPSLPPGCLTVPCCHGNRGSKASSCDWYAAEVFPNLTAWLSLSLSLSFFLCLSFVPLSPSLSPLSDFLSGGLRWWVQPTCLYLSAPWWHSALPCQLIVLTDISPNWGSDMKDRVVQMKAPKVNEVHNPPNSQQPVKNNCMGVFWWFVCLYVEWVNPYIYSKLWKCQAKFNSQYKWP